MGVKTFVVECVGEAIRAFIKTKAKLEVSEAARKSDYCPDETKVLIHKMLVDCQPSDNHLTEVGRRDLKRLLDKNDLFGSRMKIDSTRKEKARSLCIAALKTAAACICKGTDVDIIRSVTYSYLASNLID